MAKDNVIEVEAKVLEVLPTVQILLEMMLDLLVLTPLLLLNYLMVVMDK